MRIDKHELGPRFFVGPARIHHWHWGGALVAAGLWLLYADRKDLPHRRPLCNTVVASEDVLGIIR